MAEPLMSPDPLPRGRATVLDVARLAGVSGRTVTRVVVGSSDVSPQTRRRVMDAVTALHFRPNRLARDLRAGGASTTLGFVVGDLTNPFYAGVAAGVERVLGELGLTMLLAGTNDDPAHEARTVDAVLGHRVRALLLVPIGEDHAYLERERDLGTPVVAVDRPAANVDIDSVVFDNRGGAAEAIRSLVGHGHRRIAFVGSGPKIYTHRERHAGYRDALRANGIAEEPDLVRTDAPDSASAERATRELFAVADPPSAVFAANNLAAIGVLRVLGDRLKDTAVVAFDDFGLADVLRVTVVAHDPDEMGGAAARLALAVGGPVGGPATQVVLPTRLVRRGSGEVRGPAAG